MPEGLLFLVCPLSQGQTKRRNKLCVLCVLSEAGGEKILSYTIDPTFLKYGFQDPAASFRDLLCFQLQFIDELFIVPPQR